MNRHFKRVLAGLAALTLCVGVVPSSLPSMISNTAIVASAAVDLTGYTKIPDSDAYYKIDGNTLYVDSDVEDSVIPKDCFFKNINISGVEIAKIGKNVTKIGQSAFLDCTDLKEVYMTDVTEVDGGAFGKCGLTIVSMPNVTSVGGGAFADCSDLTTLNMPNVASVGGNAFHNCKFTTVYMPNVTNIDSNAFYDCGNLTTVYMPNVTSVKGHAFGGCNLSEITLGANPPENFEKAFREFAFFNSAKFLIPAGSEANYAAFASDFEFETYVAIPEGYTQIGDSNAIYKIDGDTLYVDGLEKNTEVPKSAFDIYNGIKLPETVTKVVIEENISSIGQYAFCYCNALTEVSMPNVTSIGSYAFKWCSFKSIDMPNVTSIGSCAFDVCEALTKVSMPNVTSIGSYAFRDTAITSVDLSSVTFIGQAAFSIYDGTTYPNPNLVSVKFGETVPKGLQDAGLSSNTKLLIPAEAYEAYQQYESDGYTFYDYDGNALTSALPDGYKKIGDSKAIYKIDEETHTLYVDGLEENTEIPAQAFADIDDEFSGNTTVPSGITNLKIGTNIISIGDRAFMHWDELESIDMPSVTTIGSNSFTNTGVTAIELPSVTSIGEAAFNFCTSLQSVKLTNVTELANGAFSVCTNLETVDMPCVTSIGMAAFFYCESLESITVTNVKTIGEGAFAGCPSLKTIAIQNATSIGADAFVLMDEDENFIDNQNLTTVKLGETVPDGFEKAFEYNPSAKFLIPKTAYKNYESLEASGFKFFDEATGEALTQMKFGDYVKGIGFTLDGKIGVNLQTAEMAENFTVTCGEKNIPVVASANGVSFYIAPKEMVKEYIIEVNGTTKTITPVDIVTLYTAADKDSELAQYADLAQSLADYCKAADAYFDGDETTKVELPNYVYPTKDAMEKNQAMIAKLQDVIPTDGNTYKTSLVLDSETAFKVYVSNPNGINADDVVAEEGVKTQIDKNTVCVKISNLGPVEANNNTFSVNGGTFTIRGYVIKANIYSTDEDLINLCDVYGSYIANCNMY